MSAVYFIQAIDGGPIKIGYARNIAARLMSLQTGSPKRLLLLGVAAGGKEREHALHHLFSHLRITGEWFAPADEIFAAIEVRDLGADVKRTEGDRLTLAVGAAVAAFLRRQPYRDNRVRTIAAAFSVSKSNAERWLRGQNITMANFVAMIERYGWPFVEEIATAIIGSAGDRQQEIRETVARLVDLVGPKIQPPRRAGGAR